MEYFYEVRFAKRRSGAPKLVPYSEVSNYRGFRSVYGYTPETVAAIQETGSTAGLGAFPVYSHLLLLDFDDCPDAAHALSEQLRAYRHVVFDSGGRSIHLHVSIEPMFGAHVPAWQKAFVRSVAPAADLSIYKHTGIYRLPGTHHHDGQIKRVLKVNEGGLLTIPAPAIPEPVFQGGDIDTDEEQVLLWLLDKQIGTGERNKHVFQLARTCAKMGLAKDDAAELILGWNDTKCFPPLQPVEIEITLDSGYRGVI